MADLIWIIVIFSSIWVWVDANNIGAGKGLVTGITSTKPFVWFIGCLLFWIIIFPLYLIKRGAIMAATQQAKAPPSQGTSIPPPIVEHVKLKACPFCAEQVKAEAIKCKHCGSAIPREA